MSNYVKSTNFASKDSLASGNPLKIVKGTEIDNEFNNIATAVATKADLSSPAFLGIPTAPTAAAGTSNTQLATTSYADTAVTNERTATATLTNKTLTSPSLSNPTMTGTPVAPTAAAGTNTTQVATTAFVKTAVDNYDAALTVSTSQIEDSAVTTNKLASGERMNTTNVLNATASLTAGAVGTYMYARYNGNTDPVTFGSTVPGSDLTPATSTGDYIGSAQTGTWRCMGYARGGIAGSQHLTTLWLRIS